MFAWVISRRILAVAVFLPFAISCSQEERSSVSLTAQDVSLIAERALEGVLPGMSPEEVRTRLEGYCLIQESTSPRGGDLLLLFENVTPCEPDLTARLRALDRPPLGEEGAEETDVHPEQHGSSLSPGGFSILFNQRAAVSATASWTLPPSTSNEAAQSLLTRLLGRELDLYWGRDGQVGYLPQPAFAVVDRRKLYLRYTVFGEAVGDTVFLTLSTRATF